ncbi:ABC transporter substrate-binding protein [Desulforhabdus amnigena]|jgi:branched-chain amino acid transport system substrate-binding protein|uniref:Branched-chain amino acid ABC transporter substrate-binding protein n=1 Tax=Desulforhabdus amnigena TaxID=40218 RepID=A0A9W6D0B4_9BACT|nr:ABC transporter substrate-binding protein [Desulforhabdus amnigena]NLJ27290.1 ABC transporter substrate-binding protein [Deltaproteobacteria bacterium]GLI32938.1 branched-chain amino acid ABC transporter substrate-binding protein [Desulforhabdus amnigena]
MKKLMFALMVFCLSMVSVSVPVWAEETIKVGIILPLTGGQAAFGEIEKNSFELALEEINAAGGINGKKLELLFEDDTGKPEVARSAAEKLINKDKVVMLGGGYGSSETFAIAGVAQQNRIPFLINTGSADKITEQKWDYVFRLNQPVSDYSLGLETFLASVVQPKTAAILFEDSAFGSGGAKTFQETCDRMGIKVVLSEGYSKGGMDFKPLLVKVKEANPDLIYMISYVMDAALLMTQSMELRIMPKLFVGGGAGFTLPEFSKNAGKAAEMVFSATLWYQTLPYPGAMEYYEKFVKKFGKDTEYHGAEAYSAAYVIADTLKRTKSMDPKDVRDALAATDMKTVFGPVKFVTDGKKINQNKLPTYLVQWSNGKLELVWPKDVASKAYVYPIEWEKVWK